ncbi:MAG: hypothetical protein ACKOPN_07680 [Prochlorococcaceae cyanobacterium]
MLARLSLARLDEPLTALGDLRGTVVIDGVPRNGQRIGVEIRRADAPRLTASMRQARGEGPASLPRPR